MLNSLSLHQPIRFKRNEASQWESGSMYIQINSNIVTIEDINSNEIDSNNVYDYIATWYE